MKKSNTLPEFFIPLIALLGLLVSGPALAQPGTEACLQFETELLSMSLTGGPFPMPLASDPGNALGDSIDGYGFVDTEVTITLSSQRSGDSGPASQGQTFATNVAGVPGPGGACGQQPVIPGELDGQTFFVDSFFDVFFDITVTDVDPRPGRDFAGQPDGASVVLPDNGPTNMQSIYDRIFDAAAPDFGLAPPPQSQPYIGGFLIEIPLGGDINGNSENDKIKFTIISNAIGDANRTTAVLPDGTTLHEFDSAAFLEGAVVDESEDPPFTLGAGSPSAPAFSGPGALTGPTTVSSNLTNPVLRPDHFLSYQVKESKGFKFRKRSVFLQDQFGRGRYRVEKPVALYNPADKNNEGINDPRIHLSGYRVKGPAFMPIQRVVVQDQFGRLLLEVEKPDLLLVPALKTLEPEPLPPPDPLSHNVDHFLCYKVEDLTEEPADGSDRFPSVRVRDQFQEKVFDVKRPTRLCNPVDKEGEGIKNETRHLMCYQVQRAEGEPRHDRLNNVLLSDQFGVLQLDTKRERELCLPALKGVLP